MFMIIKTVSTKHDYLTYRNTAGWIEYEKAKLCLSHKTPYTYTATYTAPKRYWKVAIL